MELQKIEIISSVVCNTYLQNILLSSETIDINKNPVVYLPPRLESDTCFFD